MELKDTIERMLSDDYTERLIAEYQQLGIRIEKLRRVLFRLGHGDLVFNISSPLEVLQKQLDGMLVYQEALTQRIKDEKILGFGCFGDSCQI